MLEKIKVGDRVYSVSMGWGKVEDLSPEFIAVRFEKDDYPCAYYYDRNGKLDPYMPRDLFTSPQVVCSAGGKKRVWYNLYGEGEYGQMGLAVGSGFATQEEALERGRWMPGYLKTDWVDMDV